MSTVTPHAGKVRRLGPTSLRAKVREQVGAAIVDNFFRGVSRLGGSLPISKPKRHGLETIRDIPYLPTGLAEHRLDIYRPVRRTGPLPVVFYVHGGGFRFLSKDTHWLFGLVYARHDYILVNISYRVASEYRCPAAHEDAADALAWTVAHIADYGGDPKRIAFAGESAGANIVTSLAVAGCTPRTEPWAKKVWDLDCRPSAVMPACGILQVSDTERFAKNKRIPSLVLDRLTEVSDAYLGGVTPDRYAMADPLLLLEDANTPWERPLPPFFAPCGTYDPVLDDTRRLEKALHRLKVPCDAKYYRYQTHAFHAFYPLPQSRKCWADTFAFLDRYLPPGPRK